MLKVLSLFSGIGAFEKALERLNIAHEVVAYCEIDKYASKAYSIIHDIPESKNLVDVTKVDAASVGGAVDLKDIDKGFTFPRVMPLELRLKDMLEEKVPVTFYLSEEQIARGLKTSFNSQKLENRAVDENGIMRTLLARDYKDPKCVKVREATNQGYAEAVLGDSINLEHPNSKTRRGRVGKGVAQTLTTSCNQAVVVDESEGFE